MWLSSEGRAGWVPGEGGIHGRVTTQTRSEGKGGAFEEQTEGQQVRVGLGDGDARGPDLPEHLPPELMFLETSALTGENVEEAFLKCARTILNKIDSGEAPD